MFWSSVGIFLIRQKPTLRAGLIKVLIFHQAYSVIFRITIQLQGKFQINLMVIKKHKKFLFEVLLFWYSITGLTKYEELFILLSSQPLRRKFMVTNRFLVHRTNIMVGRKGLTNYYSIGFKNVNNKKYEYLITGSVGAMCEYLWSKSYYSNLSTFFGQKTETILS